jgi:hypothetical protein
VRTGGIARDQLVGLSSDPTEEQHHVEHAPAHQQEEAAMNKLPRIVAIVLLVGGAVMIVAGAATYFLVHRELDDEHIVVSDDADNFAGKDVSGPLTAYSEAMVIKKHASEIADGQTYAQLEQDDPRRAQVMTSSFLRASLFTSVVAFGVAALVVGLGVLFIGVGLAVLALDRRTSVAVPILADDAPDPPSLTTA